MNVPAAIIAIACLGLLPARAALPPPGTYGFFGGLAGQMTITSTGAVTGKMDLLNTTTWQTGDPQTGEHIYTASVLTPFSGQFLRNGSAVITTYISPQGAYQGRLYISMELDKFSEETVIHGTYQGNSGSFDYTLGYFHAYPVAGAGSRAGNYTAAFRPASADGGFFPEGNGWAFVTVKPTGRVRMRGVLGNGAPFSQGSLLRADGGFWFDLGGPFKHEFRQGAETRLVAFFDQYLETTLTVRDGAAGTEIDGGDNFLWEYFLKPESPGHNSLCSLTVEASRYTPPPPGDLFFDFGAEVPPGGPAPIDVRLEGGGLPEPQTANFSLISRQGQTRAIDLTEPLRAVEFNVLDVPATGTIAGTFQGALQFPAETKGRRFSGVILQKQNIGLGFYKGPAGDRTATGSMMISPRQATP